MKAAKITDRAAAATTNLGLANNPAAYRAIAAEPITTVQIAKAREIASRKQEGSSTTTGTSIGPGPRHS
jgi:hypothetical protein